MTLNRRWGYNKNDDNWKDARRVIFNLCDITSKGGNYLLNAGPTVEGLFPEESTRIPSEAGGWVKVNGEAIHDTALDVDVYWRSLTIHRPGKVPDPINSFVAPECE